MEAHLFTDIIEQLAQRLSGALPGGEAHSQMMPRPIRSSRDAFQHAHAPKEGAVMLLLYVQDNAIHFPLIKRPTYRGVHSGQISLPGGKPEQSDAHLVETALRETQEEIGIPAQEIQVIGSLSTLYVAASHFNVQPVVGVIQNTPTFIPDPREVVEVFQMPLSVIMDDNHKKEMAMTFPAYELISPYYDLNGEIVWGATAMIISEFSALLSDINLPRSYF